MPGYSGIRLDALEGALRARPLDLELGDEHGEVTCGVGDDPDRPLRRQEAEAREVADVVLVEEDETGEAMVVDVLEQAPAAGRELRRGNADRSAATGSNSRERLGDVVRHRHRRRRPAAARMS